MRVCIASIKYARAYFWLTLLCARAYYAPMKPIEHIRKHLFDVSQTAFGEIAGTTQASVSRWEQGSQEPSQSEMERIRNEAVLRGIVWDDRWFFEVPSEIV